MENNISNNIVQLIKGTALSFVFTLLSLFILSIALTFTNVSENIIQPAIIIITAISIFIGSSIGNIKINKNGILNGAIISILYLFILYILSSSIIGDFSLNRQSIIILIIGIVFGILGGIIGVNKK